MKKLLIKNLKYVVLSFALVIVSFSFANSASADQYSYSCSNGGNVVSNVTMGPPNSPYTEGNPTTFEVAAFITSSCTTREVGLTARNNSGADVAIIPVQSISQGGITFIYRDSINFISPSLAGSYAVNFTTEVEDNVIPPGGYIGSVFATGPHVHGATYAKKVVYVPSVVGGNIHPEFTVRVKKFGQAVPYENTTNPVPPDSLDEIYVIPQSYWSTPMPQIVQCTSNCGIPLEGANYSVVSSVSANNVSKTIPVPYHVCKYDNAPGVGRYFSPAYNESLMDTCQSRFPDADVVR